MLVFCCVVECLRFCYNVRFVKNIVLFFYGDEMYNRRGTRTVVTVVGRNVNHALFGK